MVEAGDENTDHGKKQVFCIVFIMSRSVLSLRRRGVTGLGNKEYSCSFFLNI